MHVRAVRVSLGMVLLVFFFFFNETATTEKDLQMLCLSHGGIWHATFSREGYCEYQSPGMI